MMWSGWDGFGHMGSWGWFGMIFMGLFWIAVIIGVVLLVRYLVRRPEQNPVPYGQNPAMHAWSAPAVPGTASNALQILQERCARGDIDQEEFLRRKADLTS